MQSTTNLYQLGDFTLNSGAKSKWKLELDALTDDDWKTLAYMVSIMIGPFRSVEGVPRGGLRLAELLDPYCTTGQTDDNPHLIVDDVLTTGGSMSRLRDYKIAECERQERLIVGAVIYARGPLPSWIKAVHPMPECFWIQRSNPSNERIRSC